MSRWNELEPTGWCQGGVARPVVAVVELPHLLARGDLDKDETVVCFLTGSGYKYRSGMKKFLAAGAGKAGAG